MKLLFQAAMVLLVMTLISGILYTGTITGIGQLLWADKSNGSLINVKGEIIGSELIAQQFKQPHYFWPRPSASNYNAVPSGASNLGPTSAELRKQIEQRRRDLSIAMGIDKYDIPMDLVTTSASGLDPHISLEAARLQVKRIVDARGLDEKGQGTIDKLIAEQLEKPQLGIMGETRINVLLLNLALDKCCSKRSL